MADWGHGVQKSHSRLTVTGYGKSPVPRKQVAMDVLSPERVSLAVSARPMQHKAARTQSGGMTASQASSTASGHTGQVDGPVAKAPNLRASAPPISRNLTPHKVTLTVGDHGYSTGTSGGYLSNVESRGVWATPRQRSTSPKSEDQREGIRGSPPPGDINESMASAAFFTPKTSYGGDTTIADISPVTEASGLPLSESDLRGGVDGPTSFPHKSTPANRATKQQVWFQNTATTVTYRTDAQSSRGLEGSRTPSNESALSRIDRLGSMLSKSSVGAFGATADNLVVSGSVSNISRAHEGQHASQLRRELDEVYQELQRVSTERDAAIAELDRVRSSADGKPYYAECIAMREQLAQQQEAHDIEKLQVKAELETIRDEFQKESQELKDRVERAEAEKASLNTSLENERKKLLDMTDLLSNKRKVSEAFRVLQLDTTKGALTNLRRKSVLLEESLAQNALNAQAERTALTTELNSLKSNRDLEIEKIRREYEEQQQEMEERHRRERESVEKRMLEESAALEARMVEEKESLLERAEKADARVAEEVAHVEQRLRSESEARIGTLEAKFQRELSLMSDELSSSKSRAERLRAESISEVETVKEKARREQEEKEERVHQRVMSLQAELDEAFSELRRQRESGKEEVNRVRKDMENKVAELTTNLKNSTMMTSRLESVLNKVRGYAVESGYKTGVNMLLAKGWRQFHDATLTSRYTRETQEMKIEHNQMRLADRHALRSLHQMMVNARSRLMLERISTLLFVMRSKMQLKAAFEDMKWAAKHGRAAVRRRQKLSRQSGHRALQQAFKEWKHVTDDTIVENNIRRLVRRKDADLDYEKKTKVAMGMDLAFSAWHAMSVTRRTQRESVGHIAALQKYLPMYAAAFFQWKEQVQAENQNRSKSRSKRNSQFAWAFQRLAKHTLTMKKTRLQVVRYLNRVDSRYRSRIRVILHAWRAVVLAEELDYFKTSNSQLKRELNATKTEQSSLKAARLQNENAENERLQQRAEVWDRIVETSEVDTASKRMVKFRLRNWRVHAQSLALAALRREHALLGEQVDGLTRRLEEEIVESDNLQREKVALQNLVEHERAVVSKMKKENTRLRDMRDKSESENGALKKEMRAALAGLEAKYVDTKRKLAEEQITEETVLDHVHALQTTIEINQQTIDELTRHVHRLEESRTQMEEAQQRVEEERDSLKTLVPEMEKTMKVTTTKQTKELEASMVLNHQLKDEILRLRGQVKDDTDARKNHSEIVALEEEIAELRDLLQKKNDFICHAKQAHEEAVRGLEERVRSLTDEMERVKHREMEANQVAESTADVLSQQTLELMTELEKSRKENDRLRTNHVNAIKLEDAEKLRAELARKNETIRALEKDAALMQGQLETVTNRLQHYMHVKKTELVHN